MAQEVVRCYSCGAIMPSKNLSLHEMRCPGLQDTPGRHGTFMEPDLWTPTSPVWVCSACTFENTSSDTSCSMCGASSSPSTEEPMWSCGTCTYKNLATSNRCELCLGNKDPNRNPASTAASTQDAQPSRIHDTAAVARQFASIATTAPTAVARSQSTSSVSSRRTVVSSRSTVVDDEPPPWNLPWNCPACTYENAPNHDRCEVCTTNRHVTTARGVLEGQSGGSAASSSESEALSVLLQEEAQNSSSDSDTDSVRSAETEPISEADTAERVPEPATNPAPWEQDLRQGALPIHVVVDSDLLRAPREECVICLEEYKVGDKQLTLPCFHRFHEACAGRWLYCGGARRCPICLHGARANGCTRGRGGRRAAGYP